MKKDIKVLKKVLLVDGNSILNRAFYGVRPLTTGKGLPVNALYGTLNILERQLKEISPDYAAVAFDVSKHTFRHDRYADYKAGRKGMPEELAVQLPLAKELVRAMGFTVLEKQDFEADDLLGTFAKKAEESGYHAYVFTGDRDSLQLISDNVTVVLATNKENIHFNSAVFMENYGVPSNQFVYVKALMGDSSDNIPGVPGIGEKTALKLIAQFGSLDALYADLPSAEVGKAAKEKLETGKESAYTSLWLATIDRNVPTETTIEDIAYTGWNRKELYRLLTEFEFVSALKKFGLSSEEFADDNESASAPKAEENNAENTETAGITASNDTIPEFNISDTAEITSAEQLDFAEKTVALLSDEEKIYLCDGEKIRIAPTDVAKEIYTYISEKNVPLAVCDSKALLTEAAKITGNAITFNIKDQISYSHFLFSKLYSVIN